jgi:hypothetical protein
VPAVGGARTGEHGALTRGSGSHSAGGDIKFDLKSNFKRIQINFKASETLTDSKMAFLSSKNLK